MRICLISGPDSPHTRLFIRCCLERGHTLSHLVYGTLPVEPIAPVSEQFITFSLTEGYFGGGVPERAFPDHTRSKVSGSIRSLTPSVTKTLMERAYAIWVGYGKPSSPKQMLPLLRQAFNSHLMQLEYCAARAMQFLQKIRPDIVLGTYMTNCGYVAARTGYRPFLAEAHGSDVLVKPGEGLMYRMLLRYTVRRADMIRSHAECISRELMSYGGPEVAKKLVTFPWGVDQQVFVPSQQLREKIRGQLGCGEGPVLVMTRFFEPIYGVEDFVDALPEVAKSYPGVRVILVGHGPLEAKLRSRIAQYGLDPHVFFTGRILRPEEMAAYLNAADVYVSMSLSDGASTSLQEAMACGLPVVVSDVPGNLEWVVDGLNGYVVPRKDADTLARRLIDLLGREGLRRQMGMRNLELARRRADWEQNLTRFEDTWASLIQA